MPADGVITLGDMDAAGMRMLSLRGLASRSQADAITPEIADLGDQLGP